MGTQHFTLRELHSADSPALTKLITEFDGDMTTHFQVDPYAAIRLGTEFRTLAVGVECTSQEGLVGMGTVRFGQVQYNGDILPLAFLDGLKVHKDFRGNGLGYQIARWRIERARAEFGADCVIATGMLHDNHASHAVAAKWCRDFAESAFEVLILPSAQRPPRSIKGITIRLLEPAEYAEFAAKQNSFYQEYNLYVPRDAQAIANALEVVVDKRKPYRYFAAVDEHQNLLAGAQTWARGLLKTDAIHNPPLPLRILNHALRLLPNDFIIREVNVNGLWYAVGQFETARLLWETIRWICTDQGATFTANFDVRDPTRKVIDLKPWHQPRPKITIALHGPTALNRDQLLFSLGRV